MILAYRRVIKRSPPRTQPLRVRSPSNARRNLRAYRFFSDFFNNPLKETTYIYTYCTHTQGETPDPDVMFLFGRFVFYNHCLSLYMHIHIYK